jgi:ubiquinone/menaquinone biosynthesis C-methylase UbiE
VQDDRNSEKARIAGLYNRAAPIYGAIGPAVFDHFGRRLVEVLDIPSGAQVLDVGAGRGANLFPATQKVGASGYVTGIDIAEKMVQETNADIQHRGLQNATMLHMDAENLALPDASFDYVLCSFAYFFFPDLPRALSGFYRFLRPQGKVAFNLLGGPDERWNWYEELLVDYHKRYQFPISAGGPGHRQPEQFKQLLEQVGFTDIQFIPEEPDFVYQDEQEWWASRWTHGSRYALENMPPDILASFQSEVFTRLAPLKQPDGFHNRWRQIFTIGTKPGEV